MAKDTDNNNLDLRTTKWREALIKIADGIEQTDLTNRALALLIVDAAKGVSLKQVLSVLRAIPELKNKYLK